MKRLLPIVILSLIALLLYLEFHKNIKPSSGDASYLNSIRNYRSKKDDYMRTDQGSPFAASKTAFTRLKYFEIDPSYKIQATLDLLPAQEKVNIAMSDGTTESFSKYGSVSFPLEIHDSNWSFTNLIMIKIPGTFSFRFMMRPAPSAPTAEAVILM